MKTNPPKKIEIEICLQKKFKFIFIHEENILHSEFILSNLINQLASRNFLLYLTSCGNYRDWPSCVISCQMAMSLCFLYCYTLSFFINQGFLPFYMSHFQSKLIMPQKVVHTSSNTAFWSWRLSWDFTIICDLFYMYYFVSKCL